MKTRADKYKTGVVRRLAAKGLIKPPAFVEGAIQYETMMGSVAYGVSSDTSDIDVYGFCMPPKDYLFPHLAGYIKDFGKQPPTFHQFQQHHIKEIDRNKEYDLSIYSIVKYFSLCMDNNPNMIDSLFTPRECVLFISQLGEMVRDRRKIFLHKGSWHKFKGYAYAQLNKLNIKNPDPESKRYEMVQKYGYDVKFAYHIVRLMNEAEQILMHGDIDLRQNNEQLKSIRRGEWKREDIEEFFIRKEKELESLYISSKVPKYPNETEIKQLLLDCMEQFYGDLSRAVLQPDQATDIVKKIQNLVKDY